MPRLARTTKAIRNIKAKATGKRRRVTGDEQEHNHYCRFAFHLSLPFQDSFSMPAFRPLIARYLIAKN
jgi:hypothetical protein